MNLGLTLGFEPLTPPLIALAADVLTIIAREHGRYMVMAAVLQALARAARTQLDCAR